VNGILTLYAETRRRMKILGRKSRSLRSIGRARFRRKQDYIAIMRNVGDKKNINMFYLR
jgi:hypothetical protein